MAGHDILDLGLLVVGTLWVLWLLINVNARLNQDFLFKIVKRMDNGVVTFLTVVIVNY